MVASSRVFRSRGRTFELLPAGSSRARTVGAAEATALLAPLFTTHLADPFDVARLRRIAAELAPGVAFRDNGDVLARLVSALATNRLVLARVDDPSRVSTYDRARAQAGEPRDAAGPLFEAVQRSPVDDTHWIEIQLVGEDGEGIPSQRYLIITADGRERRGLTDSLGSARLSRIPAGMCRVSFPDLDETAWEDLPASAGGE